MPPTAVVIMTLAMGGFFIGCAPKSCDKAYRAGYADAEIYLSDELNKAHKEIAFKDQVLKLFGLLDAEGKIRVTYNQSEENLSDNPKEVSEQIKESSK